jgi:hypothetical protein
VKPWIRGFAALAAGTVGCGSEVVLQPIGLPASTTAGAGDGSSAVATTVIAMKGSDFAKDSFAWNGDTYAPWGDPDGLVLLFGQGLDCSAPVVPAEVMPPSRFQIVLVVPPAVDTAGPIDLQDYRVGAYQLDVSCDGAGECGQALSSGNGAWGTLDIESSTPRAVDFVLDAFGGSPYPDVNGRYVATRCSAPPPVTMPAPALAVRAGTLPAGTVPGPAPDPDALVVVVGDAPATCASPLASIDCTGTQRLVMVIPPALQVPGTFALDGQLGATYAIAGASGSPGCTASTGGFTQGTVQIQSASASGITFRLFGSYTFTTDTARFFEVDGTYEATVCP